MVTQELLEYIRKEIAKGRTREEVKATLLSNGGWTENDLSEAFRTLIPLPGPGVIIPGVVMPQGKTISPSPRLSPLSSPAKLNTVSVPKTLSNSPSSLLKFIPVLLIVCGLGYGSWYFRADIIKLPGEIRNLWGSSIQTTSNTPDPTLTNTDRTPPENSAIVVPLPNKKVTDCGVGVAPKLGESPAKASSSVLSCLGDNAVSCGNAKAVLASDLFPTVFEITKDPTNPNSCLFKLSYPKESTLVDPSGKHLAGQYISCPIDMVKTIDNSKPSTPKFTTPAKTDLKKYISDIYLYGTLGVFVENNLDQNKIESLGCKGDYISSVIASYTNKAR